MKNGEDKAEKRDVEELFSKKKANGGLWHKFSIFDTKLLYIK